MRTRDHGPRPPRERAGGGETFTDVLRRVVRRPSTLVMVLTVALLVAVVGVAFVSAPFQTASAGLVGIPVIAWMIRRSRKMPPPLLD